MAGAPAPAVVCGDFNIGRDSVLLREFLSKTGLADAFGGRCPPTFHSEYLPDPAEPADCIDFVLTVPQLKAETMRVLFAGKQLVQGRREYLSDHVGLDSLRVFVDDQGKYARQLGVSSSPTVVRVERGRLTAAANLTSLRQLEVFVDGVRDQLTGR